MTSSKVYTAKVRDWLNNFDGSLPTYNKLISNLLADVQKNTYNVSDDDTHIVEFPVPAVFTDHTLETYNPAYEYETLMFTTLLGKVAQNGFIEVEVYTAQLGEGNDKDNWRPFVVSKVTYSDLDVAHFKEAIQDYKEIVSDSILANLAQSILNEEEISL